MMDCTILRMRRMNLKLMLCLSKPSKDKLISQCKIELSLKIDQKLCLHLGVAKGFMKLIYCSIVIVHIPTIDLLSITKQES